MIEIDKLESCLFLPILHSRFGGWSTRIRLHVCLYVKAKAAHHAQSVKIVARQQSAINSSNSKFSQASLLKFNLNWWFPGNLRRKAKPLGAQIFPTNAIILR